MHNFLTRLVVSCLGFIADAVYPSASLSVLIGLSYVGAYFRAKGRQRANCTMTRYPIRWRER